MVDLAIVGGGMVLLGGIIALLLRSVLGLERGMQRLRSDCDLHEQRLRDVQEARRRHLAETAENARRESADRAKIREQILKEAHG